MYWHIEACAICTMSRDPVYTYCDVDEWLVEWSSREKLKLSYKFIVGSGYNTLLLSTTKTTPFMVFSGACVIESLTLFWGVSRLH